MRTSSYDREQAVAVGAVRRAAQLCQAVQKDLAGEALEKSDRSPVTVADFGSQALVCHALSEAFPDDPVIAEEDSAALREEGNAHLMEQIVRYVSDEQPGADEEVVRTWIDHGNAGAYSDRFWTLDPIDGTKGFLRSDQYAIALALIVEGRVTVAALVCPNLADVEAADAEQGRVFTAVRGKGATSWPLHSDAPPTPIDVTTTADPAEARFCESFVSAHSSHDDAVRVAETLGITRESVRIDSQAKYALVARGDADIYLRLPRSGTRYVEKIWDHAAGMLVVEEAGGRVTDVHGEPLDFTHGARLESNRGVVATNGRLHDRVIEALQSVGVS